MISCIIIDDEPYAREEIAVLLENEPDFDVVAQCSNAIEAMQAITKFKPQLLFLDIQMPKISGLELAAMLDPDHLPRIVFVTAFDEYAITAFEKQAFDYLLKPIDDARFANTLTRLRKDLTPKALGPIVDEKLAHIPCFSGNKLKVIASDAVQYIYSDMSGVHVATATELVHTHMTLRVLAEKTSLVFCHRQYLIAPAAIAEIEVQEGCAEVTTRSGAKVPVSRRYLKQLKQLFGFQ
ncbi:MULTISPECIES: two-component system response regulator BtsR [Shewanella]|uniref:Two-component system response regulator BtsR n=1 Tax=Shewanella fidelis TaxID=173509 RepID=A0AAW8NNK9_9GAMM|nr:MULTISPECIES: two-component system response regulator BtsR [Shewanella]MDR8524350.1 two-component system response regulator BtsR [Shewanella fidelis]MDW4813441.1 two-component system response regulator BtsR [Shewanella fidelis]MDW4817636.1 two-component system response regulator BtsR [Shewanella fidelis]MDW4821703.1 two-component system response regulator BtsR [Shewanella fidelis]MDW4825868.1 two-component system response regulator BtsR [Shewanella fidelis]